MNMDRIPTEETQRRVPRERGPRQGQPPYPSYDSYMAQQASEYRRTPTQRPPPPSVATSKFSRPHPPQDNRPGRYMTPPSKPPQWPLPGPPERRNSPGNPSSPRSLDVQPPYPNRPPRSKRAPPTESRPVKQYEQAAFQDRMQEPTHHQTTPTPKNEHARNASYSSRMTASSIGTIPDFPAPAPAPPPVPPPVYTDPTGTKSVPLGPPPSSRRGQQSFYSTASWVSPIPEESLRSGVSPLSGPPTPDVYGSGWRNDDPTAGGTFYEESLMDKETGFFDGGDDSHLVRSASLGKKMGKPSLVHTKSSSSNRGGKQQSSTPKQQANEILSMEPAFTSSGTLPGTGNRLDDSHDVISEEKTPSASTRDLTLVMGQERSESPPTELADAPPQPNIRQSRRPKNLDMDAVRNAEARGSLTSLPDLIRRATKLATMLESGKRPPSRLDDLSTYLNEKLGGGDTKPSHNRRKSGLSDLLATFPTPAETKRRSRATWFRATSWPAVPRREELPEDQISPVEKRRRKCCGMPIWLFIIVIILLLGIIAVAIVLPLEFFVFKNLGNHQQSQSNQCPASMPCQNGGVSILSGGNCACLCTNGFTGSDCSHASTSACSTMTLSATDSSDTKDVTLGKAIPRLISDANANFSIPLSAADIAAKLNSANISCIAQNSLVTFDGFSTPSSEVAENAEIISVSITVTSTVDVSRREHSTRSVNTNYLEVDTSVMPSVPTATSNPSTTTSSSASNPTASSDGASFDITQQVLDFGRVAVLYTLQEGAIDDANEAQSSLQGFFETSGAKASVSSGSNISIGAGKCVDLVNFTVDVGKGAVGHDNLKRRHLSHNDLFGKRGRFKNALSS